MIPTLRNGWVWLDDDIYILDNVLVRNLSISGIKDMFTTFHVNGSYNPLVLLSWAIDYAFVKYEPWLYHLTNLLMHLIAVFFVYILSFRLSQNKTAAFITGLLFGIHPMHVEAVAWITARKDLLYTIFYLGGLIQYHKYLIERKSTFLISTLILFILSLFSKGSAISFPIILFLFDYLEKREFSKKLFLEKVPFFLLSIVFTYIAIKAQDVGKALQYRAFYSIFDSLSTGFYGYFVYLVKVLFPYRLSALHPYPTPSGTPNPWYYSITAIPVLAVVIYGIFNLKKNKTIVFGLGFFFITLIPVIQVLSFAVSETADRFTYLPYFSLFYLLAVGYVKFSDKWKEYAFFLKVGGIALLGYLGLKTFEYSQVWKNTDTLLSHIIRYYPNFPFSYENRGAYRLTKSQYDLAIQDCNKAITLKPKSQIVYYNLGIIYEKKQEFLKSLQYYNKAIEIDPKHISARQNRGILLTKLGRRKEALEDFNASIQMKPDQYSLYVNRAFLLKEAKLFEKAITDANKALSINANGAEAYFLKGICYRFLNKSQNALSELNTAIAHKPNFLEAFEHRGDVYYSIKDWGKAKEDYNKAIELNTQKVNIYINNGFIKLNQRDLENAISDFNKAEKLSSKNYLIYFNRAIAYRLLGNPKAALIDIDKSLLYKPNYQASIKEKNTILGLLEKK